MSELPGPIEPTTTHTIAGLHAETYVPSVPPKGIIVLTHGYAEHCGRYREVAHVLVRAGWTVLAYDVRGHGKSPGERGYVERFDIYLDDLDAMIAEARKLAPDKPLVLLGHSHGSLIMLRALAGARAPEVTSAIVSSPYLGLKLEVPAYKRMLAKLATRITPKLAQPSGLRADQLTHDKAKQAERIADTLCFDIATMRWFTESSAAQEYVAEHADRIDVPTTWLVGGDDPIADPAQSRRVANKVKGATYHDLAGMKHEVFNEVDRGKVYAQLVAALPSG